jgi:hypothetical protein
MTSSSTTILSAVNDEAAARVLLRDYTGDVLRHVGFDDVQLCGPLNEITGLQLPVDRSHMRLCHHRPVLNLKQEHPAANGTAATTNKATSEEPSTNGDSNGSGMDTADDATEVLEDTEETHSRLDFRIDHPQDGTTLEALVTAGECFIQVT